MSSKRALIVDDSKSARVVLGRMLQKYDIEVDTAESAEAAIDFLNLNRPDVIFMDHLMPGMDGLQAVQIIKNNPQTATIPIMMYTSQQGELYVGQARALGAVGVLPKLVKPVDVSKVLYQLHLLPDRRDPAPPVFIRANASSGLASSPATATQTAAGLVPEDWHPQLESALRNHDAELRRFVVANLDSLADRLTGDLRALIAETPALQRPPARTPPYLWIAAVVLALVPAIVLGLFYSRTLEVNDRLRVASARLEQRNMELTQSLSAATQGMTSPAVAEREPVVEAASPIAPLVEPVPYGEVPLAQARVEVLRDTLQRLRDQGFAGTLQVNSFAGEFCLKGSSTDGYTLAPASLPAAKCDVIGNPFNDDLSPAQHESLAFANLAASARQAAGGALQVAVSLNGERDIASYPRSAEAVTAGEWNQAAERNNRVEFTAIPGAAGR